MCITTVDKIISKSTEIGTLKNSSNYTYIPIILIDTAPSLAMLHVQLTQTEQCNVIQ